MNRTLAVLAIVISCSPLAAQSWCPSIGAQWWHTYAQIPAQYGYTRSVYVSDTLIDGISWNKMVTTSHVWYLVDTTLTITSGPYFTREVDGVVLALGYLGADTVYRFDAAIGDRWGVPFMGVPGPLSYVVTDTGTMIIDGLELGWSSVDVLFEDNDLYFQDTLVQRLGFLNQSLNPSNTLVIEPNILELRCYQDEQIYFQHYQEVPCEIQLTTDEMAEREPAISIRGELGPAQLQVHLTDAQGGAFEAVSTDGRVVDKGWLRAGMNYVDVNAWPNGMILVAVTDRNGNRLSKKVVRL